MTTINDTSTTNPVKQNSFIDTWDCLEGNKGQSVDGVVNSQEQEKKQKTSDCDNLTLSNSAREAASTTDTENQGNLLI
jgi:hypothetical protein